MKMRQLLAACLLMVSLLTVTACTQATSASEPGSSVIFAVPIPADMFSEEATLRLTLWNADQLAILKKTEECVISYDAELQREEIQCPEGIKYQEATPEEFSIPVGQIEETVEIASRSIRAGETYRVIISGMSSDNCNTVSASIEATAQKGLQTLGNLIWMTTEMACP